MSFMFKIGQEGQQVSAPNDALTNDDEMNREVQSVRTSPPSVLPIDTLQVRIFNKSTNFSVNYIFDGLRIAIIFIFYDN